MVAAVLVPLSGYRETNRMASIDGLRGLLALSVFIHHIYLWQLFLSDGNWRLADNNVVNHLGQSSVALFFMITAYLFTAKAIRARLAGFSWPAYFRGRFFRLFPLYFFSVLLGIMLTLLYYGSDEDFWIMAFHDLPRWLTFTIFGIPDTAQGGMSGIIHASVYWSLHYEWLFYLFLPFLILLFSPRQTRIWPLVVGAVFISLFAIFHGFILFHLLSFVGGVLAAIIENFQVKKIKFNSPGMTLIVLLTLTFTFRFLPSGSLLSLIPLSLVFICIANGNTLGGFLRFRPVRLAGEISYSLYLLHLPLLFMAFRIYSGYFAGNNFAFWLILSLATIGLMIFSFFTFTFIEKPFIRLGKRISENRKNKD